MELGFSDEQILLEDTIRQLCEDRFPLDALRAVERQSDGFSRAFWDSLCELGVPGIAIAEEHGGLGMGLLDTALVYEQLGRALAPSPHFTSSILAAQILHHSGDAAAAAEWLPDIAAGTRIVAVASAEPGRGYAPESIAASIRAEGNRLVLNGDKHFVPYAATADAFIILARNAATGALAAAIVPKTATGITIERQENLASEACFRLHLDNVEITEGDLIAGEADILPALQAAMFRGIILIAAQAVGAARRIHEISLAYSKERVAFGHPIGSFQAIAHYLADAIVEIEGCRTLAHQAAWMHDQGKPFEALAAMAKLQCCDMFRRVSALGIQVHGGLGYTVEADPQLFFRRAKQWQILDWDDAFLEDEIARLTIDRAEAAHV